MEVNGYGNGNGWWHPPCWDLPHVLGGVGLRGSVAMCRKATITKLKTLWLRASQSSHLRRPSMVYSSALSAPAGPSAGGFLGTPAS